MSRANEYKIILGIETSCDETAAAVIEAPHRILSNVVSSQVKIHSVYGGVVPELASRHHLKNIVPVVEKALCDANITLDNVDCIAVTQGPGLIGALVVGLSFAKAVSATRKLPLVGVNHVHAHLHAIFLEHPSCPFPHIGVIVSGGHTSIYIVRDAIQYELLGQTRDDAAGEAIDKVAKVLGLPYPGGPIISKLAEKGDRTRFAFPRARLPETPFDFSFSGLKTAVINTIRKIKNAAQDIPTEDVAASFEEAVVEVIVDKAIRAAQEYSLDTIVLSGGVAANRRLRDVLETEAKRCKIRFLVPSHLLCTDDAAMVASLGFEMLKRGITIDSAADAYSRAL